ncbi:Recombinase [Litoreibacter ascidiaceicola]|uniref:Recombinase n=1 Tax=Litoreibacter ascidiaceicola TaxID=1486859 RepID=A0A1M4WDJ5_9RHOB|nr:recombinase family protein [Litoreibacter ascidiaceicola]SHE79052.1 Recombinase [Litoreibacter ascidiaceicola]
MKRESEPTKSAPLGGAVLYARVSTGRQAEKDLSIPDQFLKMHGYCSANGLECIREFSDAYTGTSFDRPGLHEMRELIQANPGVISVVLVHSFSRLGRDSVEFELFRRELQRLGVKLISITQDVGDTAGASIFRKIINLMDEQFSLETSKHVIRSMGENARQGFWNGGTPPFGYRAVEAGHRGQTVKKKLAVHPAEAEDVRLIYNLYLEGDGKNGPMGIKKIACYLNENTFSRRGGAKWTTGQVHLVLHDTVYIGEFIFRKGKAADDQIIVEVPAIIDAELFEQVQQRLKRNNPRLTFPK